MSIRRGNSSALTYIPGNARARGGVLSREESAVASLRKARLLDLSFIFNQIIEGSIDGAYSERFLTGKGHVHLLKLLLLCLLPFCRPLGKAGRYEFLIFQKDEETVGFAGIHADPAKANFTIGFFGVAQEHRGRRYGRAMLNSLLTYLPPEINIDAYATKYSPVMQHILTKAGFGRMNEIQAAGAAHFILRRDDTSTDGVSTRTLGVTYKF